MAKGYVGISMSYTPVEYIQSTGAQYIDTGFKADSNTKVEMQVKFNNATSQEALYCCRDFSSGNLVHTFTQFKLASNTWRCDYSTTGTNFSHTVNTTTLYTYTQDKNVFYENGNTLYTASTTTFAINSPMYIFASNNADGTFTNRGSYKLYSFKIWDNGVLIRDFIPAVDNFNVACLYEQVEGKLYYNAGSGTFTAGSATGSAVTLGDKARKLIKGYIGAPGYCTPVEYIQSTGTQYIDTGFKATANTRVLIDFKMDTYDLQDRFFGSYSTNGIFYCFYANGNQQYGYAYQDDSGNWVSTGKTVTSNRIQVDFNGYAKTLSISGGVSYSSSLSGGATKGSTNNLYVFTNSEIDGAAGQKSKIKLYSCKIYDGETLVRDYIPVLTDTNIACLYDNVTQELYLNKGTGSFGYGSATGDEPIDLGMVARRIISGYVGVNSLIYTPADYIESSGTQYIDTGVKPTNTTKVEIKISAFPPNPTWGCVFGSRTAGGSSDEYSFFRTDTGLYRSDFAGNRVTFDSGTNLTNETVITKDGNQTTIGGQTITNTSATFTGTYNMWLFANNTAGTKANETSFKLYYCKVWNDGTLVRDFIPALDSNNVACLYDLVEGKYYYNKGTGTFTAGTAGTPVYKDVARLSFGGAKELQYIETTGTQFINTGIAAKSTTCVETKFQITTSSTSMGYLCGCYQNGSGGNRMYVAGTGNGYITFATTSDAWDRLFSWTQNEVTLIYNNASRQIVWNGTPKSGKTAISLGDANTQTIGLFSINPPENIKWKCKMFYFKISNRSTGEVLLHLIPVQRQDGVVCFYDKVSETYFENQGTGDFIAGPGA